MSVGAVICSVGQPYCYNIMGIASFSFLGDSSILLGSLDLRMFLNSLLQCSLSHSLTERPIQVKSSTSAQVVGLGSPSDSQNNVGFVVGFA